MKTKFIFVLLFLCLAPGLFSQKVNERPEKFKSFKSIFDINYAGSSGNLKSTSFNSSRKILKNNIWEYSLMSGGYFTIGTNNGISDSTIDNNCQLTFGHPYAMTSFAFFTLDDVVYKPEDLSSNEVEVVIQNGDTLKSESKINNSVKSVTFLNTNQNGNVQFTYNVINTDSISHKIGIRLLLDAALGKWGDGFVTLKDSILHNAIKIDGQVPDSIVIREREFTPEGIGLTIKFIENKPEKLNIGNWQNEYYGDSKIKVLYDVALNNHWNDSILQPFEQISFSIEFILLKPDYYKELFLRCDLPNAMSIENNTLFPGSLYTNFEIVNNGKSNSNLTIKIKDNENVFPWQSENPFNIGSVETYHYTSAYVKVPEIYDSIVVPVTFSLLKSDQVIDEITRNVFIPASPFSYEGLDVAIDSSFIKLQKLYLKFHSSNLATQQLLYDLGKNNVFLFQNSEKIKDFNLEKDTTGGTNKADIIFVLDVTGSMTEEIAGVRDNIIEFADSLSYRGIDFQLGMITFLDVIENTYPFSTDVQAFQENVGLQFAHGGDDRAENSLEALMAATQFNFRNNANRIIIWITDADYHIKDSFTNLAIKDVTDALLANGIKVNGIGDPQFQLDFYDPVVLNTGGNFYDINGNFRDILLDVTRMGESPNYLLSFYPSLPLDQNDIFKIEVHYSGLGGYDTLKISAEKKFIENNSNLIVSAYPNPIDENTLIAISGGSELTYYIKLYNIYGQELSSSAIKSVSGNVNLKFTDIIKSSLFESNKIYILKIDAISSKGDNVESQSIKLEKY